MPRVFSTRQERAQAAEKDKAKKKELDDQLAQRQLEYRLLHVAAVRIQRTFRGHYARTIALPFKRREQELRARWDLASVLDALCACQMETERAYEESVRSTKTKVAAARMKHVLQKSKVVADSTIRAVATLGGGFRDDGAESGRVVVKSMTTAASLGRRFDVGLLAKPGHKVDARVPCFKDALSEASFVSFLRDASLLSNTTSLSWLHDTFVRHAVQFKADADALAVQRLLRMYETKPGVGSMKARYVPKLLSELEIRVSEREATDVLHALPSVMGAKRLRRREVWARIHGGQAQAPTPAHPKAGLDVGDVELDTEAAADAVLSEAEVDAVDVTLDEVHDWWNARRKAYFADVYAQDGSTATTDQLPYCALDLEGFRWALSDVVFAVFPPGPACQCLKCSRHSTMTSAEWAKAVTRPTFRTVHLEHVYRRAMSASIAPTMEDIAATGVVGASAFTFGGLLAFRDVGGVLREYERALQRIFRFYAMEEWDVPDAERASWDFVETTNARLVLVEFTRFCTEYAIFPYVLSNDAQSGYKLLHVFLASRQGDRVCKPHECIFPVTPECAVARVCRLCEHPEHKLTIQERVKITKAFKRWDADGSGTLDASEVTRFLQALGKELTLGQLQRIMNEIDTDKSGTVTFEEFLQGMVRGERINVHAECTALTYPEFAMCIASMAEIAYTEPPQRSRLPADAGPADRLRHFLMEIVEPVFVRQFGHAMTRPVTPPPPPCDAGLPEVEKQLRTVLGKVMAVYQHLRGRLVASPFGLDVFGLFVRDTHMFSKLTNEDIVACFEGTSQGAAELTLGGFERALDALLRLEFLKQQHSASMYDPAAWTRPVASDTGLTPMGLSKRAAVNRLRLIFETYQPRARTGILSEYQRQYHYNTGPRQPQHGSRASSPAVPKAAGRGVEASVAAVAVGSMTRGDLSAEARKATAALSVAEMFVKRGHRLPRGMEDRGIDTAAVCRPKSRRWQMVTEYTFKVGHAILQARRAPAEPEPEVPLEQVVAVDEDDSVSHGSSLPWWADEARARSCRRSKRLPPGVAARVLLSRDGCNLEDLTSARSPLDGLRVLAGLPCTMPLPSSRGRRGTASTLPVPSPRSAHDPRAGQVTASTTLAHERRRAVRATSRTLRAMLAGLPPHVARRVLYADSLPEPRLAAWAPTSPRRRTRPKSEPPVMAPVDVDAVPGFQPFPRRPAPPVVSVPVPRVAPQARRLWAHGTRSAAPV